MTRVCRVGTQTSFLSNDVVPVMPSVRRAGDRWTRIDALRLLWIGAGDGGLSILLRGDFRRDAVLPALWRQGRTRARRRREDAAMSSLQNGYGRRARRDDADV